MLKGAQPEKDAFAVKRSRDAGAIILGKANLQEFASGGISVSSLGGQVKNRTTSPEHRAGLPAVTATASLRLCNCGHRLRYGRSIRSPAFRQFGGTPANRV